METKILWIQKYDSYLHSRLANGITFTSDRELFFLWLQFVFLGSEGQCSLNQWIILEMFKWFFWDNHSWNPSLMFWESTLHDMAESTLHDMATCMHRWQPVSATPMLVSHLHSRGFQPQLILHKRQEIRPT